MKPLLASEYMTCGRVKASARKMTSGCSSRISGDAPLPEGQRLGVGVVDAEDFDAAVDPEEEDGSRRASQRPRQSLDSKLRG